MALRDLTTTKGAVTEKEIERIVGDCFRYDTEAAAVVPLPPARVLGNRAMLLAYFAALRGWPFVVDHEVPAESTPAELEAALGIGGGTLRPTLKSLKDQHFLSVRGRSYSLKLAALHLVAEEVDRVRGRKAGAKLAVGARLPRKTSPTRTKPLSSGSGGKKARNTRGTEKSQLFESWLQEGYFKEARTLSDVHERFHAEGEIVPLTSIPGYMLRAVRDRRLRRKKENVSGKIVWVYRAA